ncbi:hypothetical protein FH972_021319 [Carpinus fangiana]|uniref:Transglutaminase-like domain-containing protein n=1 Tax=Carpinus fangiana TaxID=176857 RepID=A0A5N6KPK5_9ROSI|nr:hypothetical protein FH972_021319 [Carpinus fangiana]
MIRSVEYARGVLRSGSFAAQIGAAAFERSTRSRASILADPGGVIADEAARSLRLGGCAYPGNGLVAGECDQYMGSGQRRGLSPEAGTDQICARVLTVAAERVEPDGTGRRHEGGIGRRAGRSARLAACAIGAGERRSPSSELQSCALPSAPYLEPLTASRTVGPCSLRLCGGCALTSRFDVCIAPSPLHRQSTSLDPAKPTFWSLQRPYCLPASHVVAMPQIPRKPLPVRTAATAAAPPPPPVDWTKQITERFRQALSTNRMNELSSRTASMRSQSSRQSQASRHSSQSRPSRLVTRHGYDVNGDASEGQESFDLGALPTHTSLKNLPLIPTPPMDDSSRRFRNQLHALSETPCKWENPGLLDEAMKSIPLESIYREADEEAEVLQATADSIGKKAAWAHQDCVIRALLKWFRNSFFTWVNNPACSQCRGPTIGKGMCAPTPDEKALGGNRVELYQCAAQGCGAFERFPRYNDAFVLMQTRRGRAGEWVNCFGMLCRAMGSRVRWIWNSDDFVWAEVYSEYRKRWVHVDPCEAQFDKPLMYTDGWHRKLGYCIAFSHDGCMDVTRRYCRNPVRQASKRDKAPEAVLHYILDEIRAQRRRDMDKSDKFRLEGEDAREAKELRHYYVAQLTHEIARLVLPGSNARKSPAQLADEQKARELAEERRQRLQALQGKPDTQRSPNDDGAR